MEVIIVLLLFALGIVLVVKGGDFFVDAASWMAEASGIPKLIIGATVVSLATTLPEMLVSVTAAIQGKVDMSIGNAVGSVTCNLGLIMGISLVFMAGAVKRSEYLGKSLIMLMATVAVFISGFIGAINPIFSAVLIVLFAIFAFENVTSAKKMMLLNKEEEKSQVSKDKKTIIINIAKFVLGTAGIVFGANLLVDNGSKLARLVGISERIIGVTLVAVGTSLPELITTITAIAKKQSALSVGNIIGANILDLTLIMPISSIISGKSLPVSTGFMKVDFPFNLLVGLIALVPMLFKSRFKRWQGFALLAVYAVYVVITSLFVA